MAPPKARPRHVSFVSPHPSYPALEYQTRKRFVCFCVALQPSCCSLPCPLIPYLLLLLKYTRAPPAQPHRSECQTNKYKDIQRETNKKQEQGKKKKKNREKLQAEKSMCMYRKLHSIATKWQEQTPNPHTSINPMQTRKNMISSGLPQLVAHM